MAHGLEAEDRAVKSGHWLLYRFNPTLIDQGKNPLILDCKEPSISFKDYAYLENRFRSLKSIDAVRAKTLIELGQQDCDRRWNLYSQMAKMDYGSIAK